MASTEEFDLGRIGGHRVLDALIDEILAAGEDALRIFRSGIAKRTMKKPDRSPVTEADEAVERRLRAFVERKIAHAAFVGEEMGSSNAQSALRFIVDPIDGTRAFIRGMSSWTILVGLEADGIPSLGIAYYPATHDLLIGIKGRGAHENGKPLHVSSIEQLSDAMVCHSSLLQFDEQNLNGILPILAKRTYTQRGFADFDGYRCVARGQADAHFDPSVQPWDICAAAVIVCEAGGVFTGLDGSNTLTQGGLASNGKFHDELLAIVKEAQQA